MALTIFFIGEHRCVAIEILDCQDAIVVSRIENAVAISKPIDLTETGHKGLAWGKVDLSVTVKIFEQKNQAEMMADEGFMGRLRKQKSCQSLHTLVSHHFGQMSKRFQVIVRGLLWDD